MTFLKKCLEFIDESVALGKTILVHDDNGVSIAACVVVIWLCTRKRMRIDESIDMVVKTRRDSE